MSIFSRLRSASTSLTRRHFSSILSPNSSAPLTSQEKSRAALALLKSEKSPDRIVDICRAAALTPDSPVDRIAYSVAVNNLSRSSHFDVIRQFLEESKSRPDLRTERFFSHAIVLYGQAGMIAEAINTFRQIEELGVRPTVKSLNALLLACVIAKDIKEIKRIFIDFPKAHGIDRDVETYNHMIRGFAETGSSSLAFSMLAEMKDAGIKPNTTTFQNMLIGFYKEQKFLEVEKTLQLMEEHKVPRSRSTYNVRVQSLCKLGKSDEALELLHAMILRRMNPNSVTYGNLIHGFCKEGNLEKAKKLFGDMKRRGIGPDSSCYFTIIHFLCQEKDFEAALPISKESMEKGWVPNFTTMKMLVNGLASIEKVDEAKELMKQVKEQCEHLSSKKKVDKFSKTTELWDEVEASLPQ